MILSSRRCLWKYNVLWSTWTFQRTKACGVAPECQWPEIAIFGCTKEEWIAKHKAQPYRGILRRLSELRVTKDVIRESIAFSKHQEQPLNVRKHVEEAKDERHCFVDRFWTPPI